MSTWLVYTNGLREHLDTARRRQAKLASRSAQNAAEQSPPTPASFRTDRAELITRVADPESLTRQLLAERDARTTEADHTQPRIHELEDDLTAARESLRRVIKEHNRPHP